MHRALATPWLRQHWHRQELKSWGNSIWVARLVPQEGAFLVPTLSASTYSISGLRQVAAQFADAICLCVVALCRNRLHKCLTPWKDLGVADSPQRLCTVNLAYGLEPRAPQPRCPRYLSLFPSSLKCPAKVLQVPATRKRAIRSSRSTTPHQKSGFRCEEWFESRTQNNHLQTAQLRFARSEETQILGHRDLASG